MGPTKKHAIILEPHNPMRVLMRDLNAFTETINDSFRNLAPVIHTNDTVHFPINCFKGIVKDDKRNVKHHYQDRNALKDRKHQRQNMYSKRR